VFLCAQLSYGLSTEYSKQPQASNQGKVDADRDKYAKFYVHQILSMGEEGIRDAYRRVRAQQWSSVQGRLRAGTPCSLSRSCFLVQHKGALNPVFPMAMSPSKTPFMPLLSRWCYPGTVPLVATACFHRSLPCNEPHMLALSNLALVRETKLTKKASAARRPRRRSTTRRTRRGWSTWRGAPGS